MRAFITTSKATKNKGYGPRAHKTADCATHGNLKDAKQINTGAHADILPCGVCMVNVTDEELRRGR